MKGERVSGEKHSDSEEAKYKAVKKNTYIYTHIYVDIKKSRKLKV